jgi:hypothetical protein
MNFEYEQLFNETKLFISKLHDTIKIKMETEVARLVWKRSIQWISSPNHLFIDQFNTTIIISSILESRYKRLR